MVTTLGRHFGSVELHGLSESGLRAPAQRRILSLSAVVTHRTRVGPRSSLAAAIARDEVCVYSGSGDQNGDHNGALVAHHGPPRMRRHFRNQIYGALRYDLAFTRPGWLTGRHSKRHGTGMWLAGEHTPSGGLTPEHHRWSYTGSDNRNAATVTMRRAG
jgi:hypothetical protein